MSSPLARRAIIAVALSAGFYLLALGAMAFCVWVIWFSLHMEKPLVVAIILASVALFAIARAVLPRPPRFQAPGPRLYAVNHPDIFRLIGEVARATKQPMPQEVYLINGANAAVTVDRAAIGDNKRRIVMLGIPLLQVLTISQLKAVLAHEYGHYVSGDTTLGPLIYGTRVAIERTLHLLGRSPLRKPFLWYGRLYLRVTLSISRAQELVADRISAQVAGARNAAEALIATGRAGLAWGTYWNGEVAPILNSGFLPPIAQGFATYLSAAPIASALDDAAQKLMKTRSAETFDTHPPLGERLRELKMLSPGKAAPADEPLAITLIRDVAKLERELLSTMNAEHTANLKVIEWADVVTQVLLPHWRERVVPHEFVLRDITARDCERAAQQVMLRLLNVPPPDRTNEARAIVACALASRLIENGWTADSRFGIPLAVSKDGRRIEPLVLVQDLATGKITHEAWDATCREAGIGELRLA